MKRFLQFLMTMFLFVTIVGCSAEKPNGPDMPAAGALRLSQEQMAVSAEGGEFSVNIFTEYNYETSTNVDWIEIVGDSCGAEYCTLNFAVAKNDTPSKREGVVTVFCDDYNLSATLTVLQEAGANIGANIPTNEIWYTSSDGKIVEPLKRDIYGANIVSNTYENGQGVITFDAAVTSIGNSAFDSITSLTSIKIPNSVTSIGDFAFYSCPSLTDITIPDSVISIGEYAFTGGNSLTSVTIPDSVISIGSYAFGSCSSLVAFYGKFASADNCCLIVDGVLNTFAIGCGKTYYTIPHNVTKIGIYAFWNCTVLESVTIPDSVTLIGAKAFNRCTSLTSVTIGSGVTAIGGDAFYNCTSLKEVYCKPTTPPAGDSFMFDGNASRRKIYVPTASVNAYKSADYWNDYASDIVGYDF